jgi:Protein of unknown function (DUF3105)
MKLRLCLLVLCALPLAFLGCGTERTVACSELPGTGVPVLADNHHIPYVDAAHTAYNSVPPTSGPHVPWVAAPGVYREPIPDEIQVHDLEHGHVLIQYARTTSRSDVDELESIARRHLHDVLVSPRDGLRAGIALTAWGRVEYLRAPDRRHIERFILDFAGRYDHGWRGDATSCSGRRVASGAREADPDSR